MSIPSGLGPEDATDWWVECSYSLLERLCSASPAEISPGILYSLERMSTRILRVRGDLARRKPKRSLKLTLKQRKKLKIAAAQKRTTAEASGRFRQQADSLEERAASQPGT